MLPTKNDVETHYSITLKEATYLYSSGKKTMQEISYEMNKKYKLPENHSINQMTLSNYNKRKIINTSPVKIGPKPALPSNLLDSSISCLNVQVIKDRRVSSKSMKAIIGATIKNTTFTKS